MRLRVGLRRHRGAEAAGRQVPADEAPGNRRRGRGVRGPRHPAAAGRGGEDVVGRVGAAADVAAARSVGDPAAPSARWRTRLRRGPVPPPRAAAVIATLADAVAVLHDAGYLHRDIKPGNIGFTSDGSPLLDFGLSRETDDTAVAGGTPRYSSPEVLSGHPAGPADERLVACAWSCTRWWRVGTLCRNPHRRGDRPDCASTHPAATGGVRVRSRRGRAAESQAFVALGDGARWPTRSAGCRRVTAAPAETAVRFPLLVRYT